MNEEISITAALDEREKVVFGGKIRGLFDFIKFFRDLGIDSKEAIGLARMLFSMLNDFSWEKLEEFGKALAAAIETSPEPAEPGTLSFTADRWKMILSMMLMLFQFLSENKS